MTEHTQWAVQYKNVIGGPYDRVVDGADRPFSEAEARQYVQDANRSMATRMKNEDWTDPEPYARLATRTITDWEPLEES